MRALGLMSQRCVVIRTEFPQTRSHSSRIPPGVWLFEPSLILSSAWLFEPNPIRCVVIRTGPGPPGPGAWLVEPSPPVCVVIRTESPLVCVFDCGDVMAFPSPPGYVASLFLNLGRFCSYQQQIFQLFFLTFFARKKPQKNYPEKPRKINAFWRLLSIY